MLRRRPNSGGVILARACQLSLILFALALVLESATRPGAIVPSFEFEEARRAVADHVAWLGAIFGASYALLHARFTGQWTYLAGVYNALMAAEDASPRETLAASFDHMRREKRMTWWIGFIEDAVNVHLALKPTYAEAIFSLLDEPECIEVLADPTHPLSTQLLPVLDVLAAAAGATAAELQDLRSRIQMRALGPDRPRPVAGARES